MTLTYGIYPGGRAGPLSAEPDDPTKINNLVTDLAAGHPFVVREYVHFLGQNPDPASAHSIGATAELTNLPMPDEWYVTGERQLDLVVSYLPTSEEIDGWLHFLDTVIERYGHLTRFLQVTLEPNFPIPFLDGSSPGVIEALVQGSHTARARLDAQGLHHVQIGFSVAEPAEWLGGDEEFWKSLGELSADRFADFVDYVGLAIYPDAFSPVAPDGHPGDVASLTRHAVDHLRRRSLPLGGIGAGVPIHIAENGSPSGAQRRPEEQSQSLAAMLHAVKNLSLSHHVTHHELFSLRDAHSGSEEPVGNLGLTTDTYEQKRAFETFRDWMRQQPAE